MKKVSIGLDIAKDTIEMAIIDLQAGSLIDTDQLPNTEVGHNCLIEALARYQVVHLVMEATGTYHLRLSKAFAHAEQPHAVINPLSLKRFAQMKLRRIKTDRSDAVLLAQYGREQQPPCYKPQSLAGQHLKELNTHLEQLIKQRSALKNLLHASSHRPDGLPLCREVIDELIGHLDRAAARLVAQQQQVAASAYSLVKARIESVVGVGQRTALCLLAYVGSLDRFESHKQLVAYMGLNPMPRHSGTSLRGGGGISKQGNVRLRTLFYMCALSAKGHNRVCRLLYERLRASGKAEKVALVAVANKLVKQVFTMVKQVFTMVKQVFTMVKQEVYFDNDYMEKRAGRA